MKRLIFFGFFLFLSVLVFAQISIVGKHRAISGVEGIDRMLIFDKIDNSSVQETTEIHFKAPMSDTFVQWFEFSAGIKKTLMQVNSVSNRETYIEPKSNTGYIIHSDGKETVFWVVDLSKQANDNIISYQNLNGEKLIYSLSAVDVQQKSKTASTENSYVDNSDPIEEISCKITTTTASRDSLNENQRPKVTSIDGSAPLDIQFFSNPLGDVKTFQWQIFKEGTLILTRTEQDYQFTFTESGKYKVTLKVSNDVSFAEDSLNVSLSESQIMAPNVFTPNGDGLNDEFRVAYTSIAEFQATIVNRWGRVLYSWTNPQIGWDGKINGKPAAEGTYFYIINARGSDGKAYKLKGHLNLLR